MPRVVAIQVKEQPVVRPPKPALYWVPNDENDHIEGAQTETGRFQGMLDHEMDHPPISPRYEAGRSVPATIRLPAALHERLEAIAAGLDTSLSDLVRAILIDQVKTATFDVFTVTLTREG